MFSALRASRRPRPEDDGLPGALRECSRQLAASLQAAADLRCRLGALAAEAVSHAAAQLRGPQQAAQQQLLLASISASGSAEPIATLPSKDRPAPPRRPVFAVPPAGGGTTAPPSGGPDLAGAQPDERILISEVEIVGVDGQLKEVARRAMTTKPNFAYTTKEVEVTANPELRGLVAVGGNALPQSVIQEALRDQAGATLNFNCLGRAVQRLNQWYEERGILGHVTDVTMAAGNVVEVRVAEAVVGRINLRFLDPKTGEVDLALEVKERKSGGLAMGGGLSEGEVDSTFRVEHTDPWVRGDAYRTSRTINIQNHKTAVANIHGRAQDDLEAQAQGAGQPAAAAQGADGVFVSRLSSAVEYSRPLGTGWQGALGLTWQRARCVDEHSRPLERDCYGGPLTHSGAEHDVMALALLRVAYNAPSGDSELVASMEQALPLQQEWLNLNRFSLRAGKTVPVGPIRLHASAKGGMILGDLPPYEAFPIGGAATVRGYAEGGVGTGRNFVAGTAELRVPLVAPFEGTLFADYGTDLDSGASVLGDPAGARNKPGTGYGYGAGVRIATPIGPLRLEYAMNDRQQRRFHLGIGSHF
eukprot:scaffold11.g3922.t1